MKIDKKKIGRMLAYGTGDILGGGVGMVISTYYFSFLTIVMGVSALSASIITCVAKIWDGVTDPIMGIVVDRTRTRFGSSRPYFLIAILPLAISYFMLWYCFGIEGEVGKVLYFTLAYMLFNTCYTVAVVPYEALLPRMVDSYKERTDFSSIRMIFSGIACVASVYIYELLIDSNIRAATPKQFAILGIVLGLLFSLPLLITFFGTKEKPNLKRNGEKLTLKRIFKDYKEMLSCKLYRKYYAIGLLGAVVSNALLLTATVFIYLVFGNRENFFLSFTLVFLAVNLKGALEIAFFPLNVFLMKKFNKHRPFWVDLPFILAGCVMIAFITPSTNPWFYIVAVALIGCGVSCLGFVPMTLLPDLSDIDEVIYGKRREGVSAGLTTLGKKVVGGLTFTLFGAILTIFGIDDVGMVTPQLLEVDSTPLIALKIMYCAVPVVFAAIMFAISLTYNLDEKSHKLIKRLISEKHTTGSAVATEEEQSAIERITGKSYSLLWIAESGAPDNAMLKEEEPTAE